MTGKEASMIRDIRQATIPPIQSEDGSFVSEEQYWQEYYEHPNFNYEWNDGHLEEKPVADYVKVQIYFWFLELLRHYLKTHPIARLTGLEMGFRMPLPSKTVIRKPDLGLVLNSNPMPLGDHDRTYKGIFDLCVESLSDSSTKAIERDTIQKLSEYASAGIREYYILDDRDIETRFLQNTNGVYQPIVPINGIIQSRVLPGFQFRIKDLYDQPELIELAEDPVYQTYVLPEYQTEKRRAEQERLAKERETLRAEQERIAKEQERMAKEYEAQRAEQERLAKEREAQRAEQEAQRAEQERLAKEQLAAKLRELGIDPDEIV